MFQALLPSLGRVFLRGKIPPMLQRTICNQVSTTALTTPKVAFSISSSLAEPEDSIAPASDATHWTSSASRDAQVGDLYDHTRASLLSYLLRLGLCESDAKDVMQETFLRLIHHLQEGRPEANIQAWLFQIAYTQAMDIHRLDRRYASLSEESDDGHTWQKDFADSSLSPEEVFIQNEDLQRIRIALKFLPTQQRTCVVLRSKGLRYREIASNLGVSTQRVAVLVCRGVSRLAAAM